MAFQLDNAKLKRAGLDYWPYPPALIPEASLRACPPPSVLPLVASPLMLCPCAPPASLPCSLTPSPQLRVCRHPLVLGRVPGLLQQAGNKAAGSCTRRGSFLILELHGQDACFVPGQGLRLPLRQVEDGRFLKQSCCLNPCSLASSKSQSHMRGLDSDRWCHPAARSQAPDWLQQEGAEPLYGEQPPAAGAWPTLVTGVGLGNRCTR